MGKCVEFGSVVVVFKSRKFEGEVFIHTCVDRESERA
jgi:hypothetical protein